MSTRFAKQLIYGAFYIVLWVAVIWGGYLAFARPAPLPPPPPASQPISVLGANMFMPNSHNSAAFLAEIANPNSDLAAQYFSFSFNLYDASGTLLASLPGQSFAYSNQVKYVTLVNQSIPAGAATVALAVPTSTTYFEASSSFGAPPQLAILGVTTQISSSSSDTATVAASGNITDNDTSPFNNIFIVAVFKDAQGNPIGVSQTELDRIVPGQTENFSVIYPAITGINPAATEVEAYAERG